MIILSIVCVLLVGALLALMFRVAGEPKHTLDRREETGPQPVSSRRPFPYDHEAYPGSV